MSYIAYPEFHNPRDNRLAKEHELLDDFCQQSNLVSYEAQMRRGKRPPDRYLFHYRVRSIVGIGSNQMPIYGEDHTAEIEISPQFPLGGQPSCKMLTPLWHPNIKFDGNFAGKICINAEALGSWHTIDMLAERIGEMLQYKNYHAINEPPYPEDAKAAQWVREFAEPNRIINKKLGIYIDDRPLLETSEEWLRSRKKKIQVTILGVRKSAHLSSAEAQRIIQEAQPQRKRISIKKNT